MFIWWRDRDQAEASEAFFSDELGVRQKLGLVVHHDTTPPSALLAHEATPSLLLQQTPSVERATDGATASAKQVTYLTSGQDHKEQLLPFLSMAERDAN